LAGISLCAATGAALFVVATPGRPFSQGVGLLLPLTSAAVLPC
jgi:hypothetical protein